ncbi:MAG: YcxB family protein [Candidatus Ventricola sp.]
MGAVVLGIVNLSAWWGVLLIAYGSYLASGRYNSANHTAHKLAKQIRESGMDFPASRYVFREHSFEIIPLDADENGEPLAYADVHRLGEDAEYFYIFRDQYGGYMIPKAELGEKEKEFRLFMEKKTQQTFEAKAAPILKLMRRMDTQKQKSRKS